MMKVRSVGEKVKVKNDLELDWYYEDVMYCKEMDRLRGQIVTIDSVSYDDGYIYTVKECVPSDYLWSGSMFEDVGYEYICILDTRVMTFIRKIRACNKQEAEDKFINYLDKEIDGLYFWDKDDIICRRLDDVEVIS